MEIGNRRIKYEDGKFYVRAFIINKSEETKEERWNEMKFKPYKGYLRNMIKINKKNKSLPYHRLVYKIHNPDWDMFDSSTDNSIDHINGNSLDNRIENLRVVTHQGNQHNQVRAKGYSLTRSGRYGAHIKLNNKKIHLGTYDTEDEARQAYLEGKKKYHVIDSPRMLG